MMFIISTDNSNIYYDSIGSGPVILLLHGFGNNHEVWQETGWIEILKKNFTVVTLDLRGCGKSDKPMKPNGYSLENHLNDISKVLEMVGCKEAFIWGWSLGATLAMHYAARNKVIGIIACGSYFGLIFSEAYIDRMLKQNNSEINRARIYALKDWSLVFPKDLNDPFLIYTGTKDGNVYSKLLEQKNEIESANGIVSFLAELDHIGLIKEKRKVLPLVEQFLNKCM